MLERISARVVFSRAEAARTVPPGTIEYTAVGWPVGRAGAVLLKTTLMPGSAIPVL